MIVEFCSSFGQYVNVAIFLREQVTVLTKRKPHDNEPSIHTDLKCSLPRSLDTSDCEDLWLGALTFEAIDGP